MAKKPTSHRRDFMSGRSAAKAIQERIEKQEIANGDAASDEIGDENRRQSLLLHLSRRAMATEFEIYLNDQRDQDELEMALETLDLLEELEDQLSVYREHSEVSRINRQAFSAPQTVEQGLFQLLGRGLELFAATEGAFDLTSTPLSRLWGFFHRQGTLPTDEAVASTLQMIGSQHVRLDRETRGIRFDLAEIELNLGAMGKGYALDLMSQNLLGTGVTSFLLHGGLSSVRASGCRDGSKGWRIDLKHPLVPTRSLGEVTLCDQSLATSGCGNQFFYHRGTRLGHIIDPRNGYPVEWEGSGVHSATAIADSATDADALATAFYVMGVDETRKFCKQHSDVAAIFVVPAGRSQSETVLIGDVELM